MKFGFTFIFSLNLSRTFGKNCFVMAAFVQLSHSFRNFLCSFFFFYFDVQCTLWNPVLHVITHVTSVLYFYISTFRSMCAVHSMAVFSSSWSRALPVCGSDIFWRILRWFQLLRYYSYRFCFTSHIRWISNVKFLCFQIFSAFISWSHSCLQKLQYLLTYMFIFNYHW